MSLVYGESTDHITITRSVVDDRYTREAGKYDRATCVCGEYYDIRNDVVVPTGRPQHVYNEVRWYAWQHKACPGSVEWKKKKELACSQNR